MLTLLYFTLLTYFTYLLITALQSVPLPIKLFYALKETRFTVYRYTSIRAAGGLQPAGGRQQVGGLQAAAGWGLQAGGCKVGRYVG